MIKTKASKPTLRQDMSPGMRKFLGSWQLLILFIPCFLYFLLYRYIPLWGISISFMDYMPFKGISGSEFVGLKHYIRFFQDPRSWLLVRNTFLISFFTLLFTFPFTIIFALVVNEVRQAKLKKAFQTISYMPHFISIVVVVGLLKSFLTPGTGLISQIVIFFGGPAIDLLSFPEYFRSLYVFTALWQSTGWSAIIYFAAISNIDQELYESAVIDGANKWKQIIYITLPCIMPTIITLLILSTGNLLSVGFEKTFLMQTPATYSTSDVISTYVYRQGLVGGQFSYTTAVGLFNSVVNLLMLVTANSISRRFSEHSIW